MLEDVYKHNPKTLALIVVGLTTASLGLTVSGMMAKKKRNCKILFGMGIASYVASIIVAAKNQPIGIYSKNPQEVINWLRLEGFTNLPEDEIRKTGHFFWGK